MLFHQITHLLHLHLTRISSSNVAFFTEHSGGLLQSITVWLSATVSQYASANLEEAGIGDRFMGSGANLFFQRNRLRQRATHGGGTTQAPNNVLNFSQLKILWNCRILLCVLNVTSVLRQAAILSGSAVFDQIACQQLGLEYQAMHKETSRNPRGMGYLVRRKKHQRS